MDSAESFCYQANVKHGKFFFLIKEFLCVEGLLSSMNKEC